ncbi:MAG: DUF805 domain-containing protein [Novosphingobium sp.]|nr:DUF805 domain-containing protein [Novosphingobium sp.]
MLEWAILPFRRYFDFQGRSRRMEYWSFALLIFVVYLVLVGIMMAGGASLAAMSGDPSAITSASFGPVFYIGVGLLILFALAVIIPSIAVVVRRLHDRDMSGWWYLGFIVASMIPFVGFIASIALLVLMFLPGTPGPNRFGPDPKGPGSTEVFA